jgi:CubicO group peptidase (beta-lactamase class C family)
MVREFQRVISTLAVLMLAASPAQARPAVRAAAAQDPALARVQAVLDSYVASGKTSGIVVAIGRNGAPPTFLSAGRIADASVAPIASPDSLWRVYSMTKLITAVAAMILIEEGKLRLDQPIGEILPAWRSVRVLDDPANSLASHPARHPITVRNLLTHTSGLTYQFLGSGPLPEDYKRNGLLGGRVPPAMAASQPQSLADFADRLSREPLLAEPGSEWNYSVSLDLLGRVIEVASGKSFDRFVEDRVLKPLGMTSTYWTVPRAEAARLATSYSWNGTKSTPLDTGADSLWLAPPLAPYGGSGLVSSARDYDRFLRMLAGNGKLGNVRVLKAATVRLAMSNLLPDGVRVIKDVSPAGIPARGFGAGGSVYLESVPSGVSAGTYGWFGAAGTIAFLDPARRLRVTVMVNYMPMKQWPLYDDVVRAIYSGSAAKSLTGPVGGRLRN